ncbi:hypothetical protein RHGRI_024242 [Rhododendron griersonianum]|uniref:Uncharacterized protein n=1 Tax=Rhododendron griersonianum TaxID=479676 RepID=A0AAV6JB23_9ERIC|nr:hypothetical protein RHGRI_024242 [Rhododendron griersonianum]
MDTNPTMESVRSQSAHSPPEKGVAKGKAKSKKPPLKKAKKPVLKRKRRLTSQNKLETNMISSCHLEIDNVKLDDVIEDIMNLNLDNDQSESVGCSSSVINVEP